MPMSGCTLSRRRGPRWVPEVTGSCLMLGGLRHSRTQIHKTNQRSWRVNLLLIEGQPDYYLVGNPCLKTGCRDFYYALLANFLPREHYLALRMLRDVEGHLFGETLPLFGSGRI